MILGRPHSDGDKHDYLATERNRPPLSPLLTFLKSGTQQRWSAADDFVSLTVDEPRLRIPVLSNRRGDGDIDQETEGADTDAPEDSHIPPIDTKAAQMGRSTLGGDSATDGTTVLSERGGIDRATDTSTVAHPQPSPTPSTASHPSALLSRRESSAVSLPPVVPQREAEKIKRLLFFEGVGDYDEEEDQPRLRDDHMSAGTMRSKMLPEVLDSKLRERFMRGAGKQDFFPLRDPAQLMIERLRHTKYVARIARLGENVYGKPPAEVEDVVYVPPELEDLSQGADAYDSDDDDGYLRTDHLVADLSTLPMSTARRHVLAKRTLDAYSLPTTARRHWPPRVQSPNRDGPLGFQRAATAGVPHHPNRTHPSHPPPQTAAALHPTSSTRRASLLITPLTPNTSLSAQSTAPPSRNLPSRYQTQSVEFGRASMGAFRSSEGSGDLWVSSRDRAHHNQERLRSLSQDVMVEEMFEAGVVSQRKAALPFRRCYDLNYHVRTRATHRDIDFAAEAGPEAVAGPLSRHSVQTSAQAQSEMIMFQRRLDRMLLQTPGRVNLAHSLASPRLFNLLLVALPANPAIEDLQLANNNLDDGHAESLVEAIMSAGCVKKLDLSHNRLTWVAVSNFADMLTSKPRQLGGPQTQLAELKLDHNPIGSRGGELLADAVLRNASLHHLSVRKCGIGGPGAVRIGSMLSESPTIISLDLSWNTLGLQGVKAVLIGLGLSPTLQSLNLSHNYFGDAAGPHVLEGLRLNENLTALDISHNFLGINTCHAISSGFTSNNKLKLRKLVMDGNHCTLAGGLLLLRVLESAAPEQDIQISLRECTFEKAGHRTEFSADEPEGSYKFQLEVPEQRAAAIQLLQARNQQLAQAWQVCQLDGRQWHPAGPWDPEPQPPTEGEGDGAKAKKTKNAGGKNKGKVGDEEGEEEEGWVDPRLPQAALPKRGELLVEFRNVFMPEAYGCAAEPMSGALFARLWSDHQRPDDDATDQFRLHLVRVICCRYWFSITQAVQVLATFLHPKEKLMAAELLYRRLVSYSGLEAMHGVLSSRERSELFEQTGVCRAVDCRCLTGHYSLDLRLRTHNCAANLLQSVWREEIATGECVGSVASCWRNIALDGRVLPAVGASHQRLPSVGHLELDFVSYRRVPPPALNAEGEPVPLTRAEWRQLTPSAFSYLLNQLTDPSVTTTALGDAHFMSLLDEWQEIGLEEDEMPGMKRTKSAKMRRRAAERTNKGGAADRQQCRRDLEDMMQPSVERAALNRQSSRKEQLTFISKLLRQTDMAFGEVVDAAKAVALLQTVFTKYTLDYKQMLILLHRFAYGARQRVVLLKKLFTRIEERDRHISSIVEFGLSPQEKEEAASSLGIMNITSWSSPSGHYTLSMDREDHRYCLYRLLKIAIAGGNVDVRMFMDFRFNGESVPPYLLQEKQLWKRILDESLWEQLALLLTATNPRLSKMMQWFNSSAAEPSTDLRTAVESAPLVRDDNDENSLRNDAGGNTSSPKSSRQLIGTDDVLSEGVSTVGRSKAMKSAPSSRKDINSSDGELDLDSLPDGTLRRSGKGHDVVDFVFEAAPELRYIGTALLATARWKKWAKVKRSDREARAVARVEEWWHKRLQSKKLREMQQMLDEQERMSR